MTSFNKTDRKTDGARSRAGSRAFTLIEVMVAMVIATMAVTVVFSGLGVAFDMWSATTGRLDDMDAQRYQWETLRRELGGALPVRRVVEDGLTRTPVLAFDGGTDTLSFVSQTTFGAGPFAPARWVEWRVSDTGELEIQEKDLTPPDNAPADVATWMGAIPNVDVRFEFLRPATGADPPEWLDQWRPVIEQSLPDAVRITGNLNGAPVSTLIRLDYAESGRSGLILE